MKMRKIIAVLAAVLMLCSVISMSAVSVSAADAVYSEDFEKGTVGGWQSGCTITAETADGNTYLQWDATGADWANTYLYSGLAGGVEYKVSFRAKANMATTLNVKINNNWAGDTGRGMVPVTTEWQDYSLPLTSGVSGDGVMLMFTSNASAANAAVYCIDDIVVEAYENPAENLLTNGDFENGSLDGWTRFAYSWGNSTGKGYIDNTEAYSGSYSMKMRVVSSHIGPYQTVAVEPNTNYMLSLWHKSTDADGGSSILKVTAGGVADYALGADIISAYTMKAATTEWTKAAYCFNSGDNTQVTISTVGVWETTQSETMFVDDIVLVKADAESVAPDEPEVPEVPSDAIYSGNFEDGALGGWSASTSSVVAAADLPVANADGGSYALKFVSTSYSYTNYALAVEKNTTYRVQYSILSAEASRPLNVRIRTGGSVDLAYNQHAGSTAAWQTFTLLFNSGDETTLNFRFQSAHSTCTYYIDNLTVTPVDVTQKDDGYIKNGDFESGMADNWDYTPSGSYVADPTNSGHGYVLQTNEAEKVNMIAQPVNIVEGKEYVLYFMVYGYSTASNSAIYVRLGAPANTTWDVNAIQTTMAAVAGDVSDTWTRQVRLNMNSNTGKWCYVAVPFTAAKTATINASIYNYRPSEGKYYFDDFVVFEKKAASNDGYIQNGDFETGVKGNFSLSQSTQISQAAAKDGNFGAELIGNGGWGGLIGYTFAVENGATYKLSFDAKAISVGANVAVLSDTWEGTKLVTSWISGDSWKTYDLEFTAISDQCYLNMNGGGNGTAEHVYVDNVVVTKIADAPVACEHAYNYDCDKVCKLCGAETRPEAEHSYFYPCDKVCQICYEETNPDVAHDIEHVAAKDATCGELGNIEYWYCKTCGQVWLDEDCTLNTNMMAVKLPTIDHTYSNIYDAACDVCGGVREVPQLPVEFGGKSISEDVSGLAFKYDLAIEGVAIKNNTYNQADFTNATFNGHKLLEVGVIASNGQSSTKIQGVHMCELEGGVASFVYRVVNIPADKLDAEITMTPYYVVEIDGVETTVYGEAMVGSYAEIAG